MNILGFAVDRVYLVWAFIICVMLICVLNLKIIIGNYPTSSGRKYLFGLRRPTVVIFKLQVSSVGNNSEQRGVATGILTSTGRGPSQRRTFLSVTEPNKAPVSSY